MKFTPLEQAPTDSSLHGVTTQDGIELLRPVDSPALKLLSEALLGYGLGDDARAYATDTESSYLRLLDGRRIEELLITRGLSSQWPSIAQQTARDTLAGFRDVAPTLTAELPTICNEVDARMRIQRRVGHAPCLRGFLLMGMVTDPAALARLRGEVVLSLETLGIKTGRDARKAMKLGFPILKLGRNTQQVDVDRAVSLVEGCMPIPISLRGAVYTHSRAI